MTDSATDKTPAQPTPAAKAPSLQDRVDALEPALASLGDAVSPGHRDTLAPYINWRKSFDQKGS